MSLKGVEVVGDKPDDFITIQPHNSDIILMRVTNPFGSFGYGITKFETGRATT